MEVPLTPLVLNHGQYAPLHTATERDNVARKAMPLLTAEQENATTGNSDPGTDQACSLRHSKRAVNLPNRFKDIVM